MGRVLALRDPFGALTAAAQSMASTDMGAAFAAVHSHDTIPSTDAAPGAAPGSAAERGRDAPAGRSRHVTRVTRCFYVDFFARHGSPQVGRG